MAPTYLISGYNKGEIVLCSQGIFAYKARVLGVKFLNGVWYLIHYVGWSTEDDEWVEAERLTEYSKVKKNKIYLRKGLSHLLKCNETACKKFLSFDV